MAFSINALTLTGTHTITNGSKTVTGVGSAYNTQLLIGSPIVISGQTRFVETIVSATSITVTQAFTASASSVAGTYNTTVTQSATDASLDGLSTLPAIITTARIGGFTSYDFGVLRLIVSGNLSIGAEVAPFEQIIIGRDVGPSTAPDIEVLSGAVLNIGHQYTSDSLIDSVSSQTLVYEPGVNKGFDESNGFTTSTAFLRVNSGGTLNWLSGVINIWGGIVTNAGSTLNIGFSGMTRKPVLDYMRVYRTVDGAQQWYSQGTTNIFGMILLGGRKNAAPRSGAGFAQLSLPTVLTGIEFKYVFAAFLASSLMNPGTYVFSNIGDTRGRPLFSVGGTGSDRIVEFLNYEKGSDFLIAATTSGRSNTVRATKNYIVQTKGVSSSNISSVVYVIGKSGTQKTLSSTNGSTTTDKFLLRETIYQGATTPSSDVYFSKNNNNTDLIDIYSFNYLYEIVYQPNFELKGNLTKTTSLDHKLDANVTLSEVDAIAKLASSFSVNSETNTITVTANSTLDDLYDALKAWKTRNVQSQLEYPTIGTQPVTVNGDTLVTSMNIVGFEFLTAGIKFKKIQANGSSTTRPSNITIIGNITNSIASNCTGLIINGNLTSSDSNTKEVIMTNSSISGILSNTGTGIITNKLVNSTIGTLGTRQISYIAVSLEFNLNGGNMIVYNPDNSIFGTYTSNGSINFININQQGTYSYLIRKFGQKDITGTFVVNTTTGALITAISAFFIPDTGVVDTLANVKAYTVLDTSQKIYDWVSYNLATVSGLQISRTITISSSILNLGAYTLVASALSLSSSTIGINTSTVSGMNITTLSVQNGISPTYPQQIIDSVGTTNWLKVTLTSGQVCQDSYGNTFKNSSYVTLLPKNFSSTITLYITARGYKKQVIDIPYSTALIATQSVTLIPDSAIVDTSTDFTSVNLATEQNVYDAYGQYQATESGILDTYLPSKSPGAIDFLTKGVSLNTTTDFTVLPIKIKTTGLTSGTYYSTGNFTQGVATLADSVRIRFSNLDSEIVLSSINLLKIYPTSTDRDSNTNLSITISTSVYRYKYGSSISGSILSGILYTRATSGTTTSLNDFAIVSGNSVLSLDSLTIAQATLSVVQSVNKNMALQESLIIVNKGVQKVSKYKQHKTDI